MSVNASGLLDRLSSISPWERAGNRAPNKPLTLLWALGRVQRKEPSLVRFADAEPPLQALLHEFGRGQAYAEYAFWWLQSDGLWRVESDQPLASRAGSNAPTRTSLRAHGAGGFPHDVDALLRKQPALIREAGELLLDGHFARSLHPAIASACGIDLFPDPTSAAVRPRRDPRFRELVLIAYERRCAACAWSAFIDGSPIGLEAAHVQWRTLGGPDEVANGLALCSLHHLALDRGAIGVDAERRFVVSPRLHEDSSTPMSLRAVAGKALPDPQIGFPRVGAEFLGWHRSQVLVAA